MTREEEEAEWRDRMKEEKGDRQLRDPRIMRSKEKNDGSTVGGSGSG